MKRKITFTAFALLVSLFAAHAGSNYVNKVIIANEGHYDYTNSIQTVPVTVGAYNPITKVYTTFDTIQNARFATNVIIDGASIYVAADSFIVRYDANTYQRLAITTVRGVRKLAIWNNQLLISRGEYLQTFSSYFQVYDKSTLGFLYELPSTAGPKYASEGIVVKNSVAYIAINNGFDWGNEVGLVGKVDLSASSYLNEIDLGTTGKNPEAIFLDNGSIYTVNNRDYSNASISNIDVASQVVNTTDLNLTTGCGASDFYPGNVVFQASGDTKLSNFSTSSLSVTGTLVINKNIYGMATDTINGLIYAGETDYTTYGNIFIYDLAGTPKDSFVVSVSPGNIAIDVRSATGINENNHASNSLACYPNPAKNQFTIFGLVFKAGASLEIYNIFGEKVYSSNLQEGMTKLSLDVSGFASGVYIVQLSSNPSEKVKFVKD